MQRGEVVISLMGRDKNTLLAVMDSNEQFVYVCDGKARPLHNPKRKNPRHIVSAGQILSESDLLSNRSLKKALAIAKSKI